MESQQHNLRCLGGWAAALFWLPLLIASAFAQAEESYCAQVKIQIQQELTLERQAFEAHMRINNGLDRIAIEDVEISVAFTDEEGLPVLATSDPNNTDAAFFIRTDSMSGIDDVEGAGTVAPGTSADIYWLIVPAPGAGGEAPSGELYYVGATLRYTLGGEPETVEVTPDYILVKPMPELTLDYFLPHEVYADDAFTSPIEPAEPFSLGVRVRNAGHGTARNLKIDSAQPRIVENELGLLIDFRILGSSVNDQTGNADLLIDFGDLVPSSATVGRWQMETTLSGEFTEFSADFSHADELGGELTSLIDAVNTHLLVHDVLVDLPGRDAVRDFLASDGDTLRVYESNGLDTLVSDQSDVAQLFAIGESGDQASYSLSAPPTAGLLYVKLPDPHVGAKAITSVVRGDGKTLSPHNAWRSRTRGEGAQWDHYINLFDANSSGQYSLTMETDSVAPQPPVLQFIPNRQIAEGRNLAFIIEASDPNGTVPTIVAGLLPNGASLTDETTTNIASYGFDWTPAIGQAKINADGTYSPYQLSFTASDGVLETSQLVEILVCPAWDTDCDRMADSWELAQFDTLARDGSGDFDDDGISDLDEYLNGLEVTIAAEPGTNLIAYPHQVPPEHDTCAKLLTALGAAGADDQMLRLDPATQRYQSCTSASVDTDPGFFGITTGEGYVLQVKLAQDLTLDGTPQCNPPTLQPGLNLVGHPMPTAALTCTAWLEALGASTATAIQRLDPATGRWQGCAYYGDESDLGIAGYDFPILRGEGYLISSPAGGSLVLPGCP